MDDVLTDMMFGRDSNVKAKEEIMNAFGNWAAIVALKFSVVSYCKSIDEDPTQFMNQIVNLFISQMRDKNAEEMKAFDESDPFLKVLAGNADIEEVKKLWESSLNDAVVDIRHAVLDGLGDL